MQKRVVFHSTWLPWALLLPQLALIMVFFFWPAAQALLQSVQMQDPFGLASEFVGLKNFAYLFKDTLYLESFYTTVIFSLLVAGIGLCLALILSVFAHRVLHGRRFYTTILVMPYAIAPIVVGVLMGFVFSPTVGVGSWLLQKTGIDWNPLVNANHAMALVVIASVWKQISYNFLFFLAGLQSIPISLIEAAAMDGAGPWRRFWNIQLPMLSPTSFFLLVMNIVYAFFETFAIIDATTQGGPGQNTNILVYKVYQDGFKNLDLGGSAAQSVVLMALVIGLTFIQFRFIENKVRY